MRRLSFVDLRRADGDRFARDARAGLSARPKRLPPVYFYDDEGSRLFEEITRVPEYYLTRAEDSILRANVDEIAYAACDSALVELGSGSSQKTRAVIEALLARQGRLRYAAIDVSRSALEGAGRALVAAYPGLEMEACAADYDDGLAWLRRGVSGPKLILFLGSSIGNFEADEAERLLVRVAETMRAGDRLVLGADLDKDPRVVEAAYNDAAGANARFNLNVLRRINRELRGRFDLRDFSHRAFYNPRERQVEMHLESRRGHGVLIESLQCVFRFERGETIHTENSRKYAIDELDALAARCGLRRTGLWRDARRFYCVARFELQS